MMMIILKRTTTTTTTTTKTTTNVPRFKLPDGLVGNLAANWKE